MHRFTAKYIMIGLFFSACLWVFFISDIKSIYFSLKAVTCIILVHRGISLWHQVQKSRGIGLQGTFTFLKKTGAEQYKTGA